MLKYKALLAAKEPEQACASLKHTAPIRKSQCSSTSSDVSSCDSRSFSDSSSEDKEQASWILFTSFGEHSVYTLTLLNYSENYFSGRFDIWRKFLVVFMIAGPQTNYNVKTNILWCLERYLH